MEQKACNRCGVVQPIADFAPRSGRPTGVNGRCNACLSELQSLRRAADPEKSKAIQRSHYAKHADEKRANRRVVYGQRKALIVSLHTPCVACGESDLTVLDFHHVDPATKYRAVATLTSHPEATIRAEAGKCVSLCVNCHRLLHAGDDADRRVMAVG